MFERLKFIFDSWVVMLFVSVPLAIWKLVDIIIWIVKHIDIVIK